MRKWSRENFFIIGCGPIRLACKVQLPIGWHLLTYQENANDKLCASLNSHTRVRACSFVGKEFKMCQSWFHYLWQLSKGAVSVAAAHSALPTAFPVIWAALGGSHVSKCTLSSPARMQVGHKLVGNEREAFGRVRGKVQTGNLRYKRRQTCRMMQSNTEDFLVAVSLLKCRLRMN